MGRDCDVVCQNQLDESLSMNNAMDVYKKGGRYRRVILAEASSIPQIPVEMRRAPMMCANKVTEASNTAMAKQ